MRLVALALGGALLLPAAATFAQPQPATPAQASPVPAVAVTGAASAKVQNDRMNATMRAEAEHASAAAAAAEVNARMAKALAAAKAAGVEAKSAGYGTWQQWEKGRPGKWRVAQTVSLTGADFPALAALVSRLQDEDGLLVSSIGFALAPDSRRRAEDALTRDAIRAWQQRAATAAEALGYAAWRPGRLTVSSSDLAPQPRYEMAMRAQAAPAAAPPVAVEGGATEITVTVNGEAVLEKPAAR